jgi:hypothetical protein
MHGLAPTLGRNGQSFSKDEKMCYPIVETDTHFQMGITTPNPYLIDMEWFAEGGLGLGRLQVVRNSSEGLARILHVLTSGILRFGRRT